MMNLVSICTADQCLCFGYIPVCRKYTESVDFQDIAHGFSGYCPWIQWTVRTMDLSGQSPRYSQWTIPWAHWTKSKVQWTMSMGSLDKVQSKVDIVHGQCPVCLEYLDFVHCVHCVHGHCPLIPWTNSRQTGQCPLNPRPPWTLSMDTESMEWTFYRLVYSK